MTSHNESEFVQHEPCPACGSKDNLARYTDGHGYCFGCKHYENPTGTIEVSDLPRRTDLIPIEYAALKKRGITEETCRFFKYGIGQFKGQTVQAAQYVRDGEVVAQTSMDELAAYTQNRV